MPPQKLKNKKRGKRRAKFGMKKFNCLVKAGKAECETYLFKKERKKMEYALKKLTRKNKLYFQDETIGGK
jgi:hypothetical protein